MIRNQETCRNVKKCRFCDQPMKPKGTRKRPDEYDHAQGCPYSRRREKQANG